MSESCVGISGEIVIDWPLYPAPVDPNQRALFEVRAGDYNIVCEVHRHFDYRRLQFPRMVQLPVRFLVRCRECRTPALAARVREVRQT